MPGFKERGEPSKDESEKRSRAEREARPDALAERRHAFASDLGETKREAHEAAEAVHAARLKASKRDHPGAEAERELDAMEAEADALMARYESLSKKARQGGIGEAIAEEIVTTAIVEHFVPIAPVAAVVENTLSIAKIAAEDEDTPEQRRRKERERRKREGA